MCWGQRTGKRKQWIGFDLEGDATSAPDCLCDEAQERFLDQVVGEAMLRGVRLEKVLAARARILREVNRTGAASDLSDTAGWNDPLIGGLYPA